MTPDPSFDADGFTPGHTLAPGTELRGYRIDRVLGEGGFGIVYLAFDQGLERRVAIKEYLPNSMAARASTGATVVVRSPGHAETFAAGLRSFVNEARLLARFDHPALVKVHQFWEAHGTAYMVMPYYEGPTLKSVLARLGRPPTEAEVRSWLEPLMDALAVLHAENCYHRDIAPDNILITPSGPMLLDFGAARRVIGDLTHALTAVLKPGYAPIEQYGEMPGMGQGPWTDIFALASVLYVAVSGVKPVPSVERLMDDRLKPLASLGVGRCRPGFLAAVDKALALRPEDRPHTVAEFRALLDRDRVAPRAPVPSTIAALPPAADDVDIGLEFGARPQGAAPPAPRVPHAPAAAAPTPPALGPRPGIGPVNSTPARAQTTPAITRSTPRPMPPVPSARPGAATGRASAPAPASRRVALMALAGGGVALAWGTYRALAPPGAKPQAAPVPAPVSSPATAPAAPPAPIKPPTASAPPPMPLLQSTPPAASPAPAPSLAPSPTPSLAPSRSPAPAPVPAPAPARAPPPQVQRPTTVAPPAAAAASRAPRKPPPGAPGAPSAPGTAGTPGRAQQIQARCNAILQKASRETLALTEVEFLRRECR